MKTKYLFSVPGFFWLKVIKYYLFRILRLPISIVESNWIYFLKIASRTNIKISREKEDYIIDNPEFNHRVKVRSGDSSDILVYIQIFFNNEYEPLTQFLKEKKDLVIVDAGSNVGFFALYAHHFSPTSSIYCIEPSQNNCIQIAKQQQLNKLINLKIEQAALWYENTFLHLGSKSDHLEWNYVVIENKKGTTKAITLLTLLDKYQINQIDIFKIDIEGAETKLFANSDFVHLIRNKVNVLAIETHHDDEKAFIANWLKSNGFNVDQRGELLFADKIWPH